MDGKKTSSRQGVPAGEYISPEVTVAVADIFTVLCISGRDAGYGGYTGGEEEGI